MRTTTYRKVLQKASTLWTGRAEPEVEEAAKLNTLINRRVREAWEAAWWREAMVVEQRWFRRWWDALAIYEGPTAWSSVEVYYPPTDKYYQSLRGGNLSHPPVLPDGTVNVEWWAECAEGYSATASANGGEWVTGVDYVPGDVVLNPADGRFYACYIAHTSSGALDSFSFGVLTPFIRSLEWTEEEALEAAALPVPSQIGRMRAGTVDLVVGQETGSVTGLGLAEAPEQVYLTVRASGTGVVLSAYVVDGTMTVDGFDFVLSAAVEEDGYKLDYLLVWETTATPLLDGVPMSTGTVTLGLGVDSGSVTGLGLTWLPTHAQFSVRSPSMGTVLTGYVLGGTLTEDGFSYVLSGLTDTADYTLQYVLFP